MIQKGKALKLGADVDTDIIVAARYLSSFDIRVLAQHLMEDMDPHFTERITPGDMIVATTNFGCGSSREHAPMAIKGAGISCVLAQSFARIFFRNSINIGLPVLECDRTDEIADGDVLEVDFDSGTITNTTQNQVYHTRPYPPFILEIIKAGGLVEYTQRRLAGH